MSLKERALIFACAGAILLLLTVLGAFALFESQPVWVSTLRGSEEFNPHLAWAMLAAIPTGATLGLLTSKSFGAGFWNVFFCWMIACVIGAITFFQIVILSGATNLLWISGIGLIIVPFLTWLIDKKGSPKPFSP